MKPRPHMAIRAIDPPRDTPPRRWRCLDCGAVGLYAELRLVDCTFVHPPCATCGQTPECAIDCRAVLDALSAPGVVTTGGLGEGESS